MKKIIILMIVIGFCLGQAFAQQIKKGSDDLSFLNDYPGYRDTAEYQNKLREMISKMPEFKPSYQNLLPQDLVKELSEQTHYSILRLKPDSLDSILTVTPDLTTKYTMPISDPYTQQKE